MLRPKGNDGELQVAGNERVLKKLPVFSLEKMLLLAFLFK